VTSDRTWVMETQTLTHHLRLRGELLWLTVVFL
jgi:hypothetical protein